MIKVCELLKSITNRGFYQLYSLFRNGTTQVVWNLHMRHIIMLSPNLSFVNFKGRWWRVLRKRDRRDLKIAPASAKWKWDNQIQSPRAADLHKTDTVISDTEIRTNPHSPIDLTAKSLVEGQCCQVGFRQKIYMIMLLNPAPLEPPKVSPANLLGVSTVFVPQLSIIHVVDFNEI